MKSEIFKYLGIELYSVSHTEKLVSGLGAFLGIFLVFYTSIYFVQGTAAYLIVASMGATAVLLFAVPHGPLSQPWSVIGGHLISAVIGVSCAKFIPDPFLAAPMAVGIAVGGHVLPALHTPTGRRHCVTSGSRQYRNSTIGVPICINVCAD